MPLTIRRVDYYYTTVKDQPGEAYKILSQLAASEVNLLAFNAIPFGLNRTQLTLFPESVETLATVAQKSGLVLDGPHPALLVQGDDELGALADVHARLYDARVNVFSSSGVTDGKDSYGYLLYISPDQIDAASAALGA